MSGGVESLASLERPATGRSFGESDMHQKVKVIFARTLVVAALFGAGSLAINALAASHREAPLTANDPTADNTDFYMFRSWTNPSNVVFVMNVSPGQEPGAGPNYYNFGDDVLYRISVDTNADQLEIRHQFSDHQSH
ncbi:MAG: DUF4331 family protein [Betaproteobacteria bacterium]